MVSESSTDLILYFHFINAFIIIIIFHLINDMCVSLQIFNYSVSSRVSYGVLVVM